MSKAKRREQLRKLNDQRLRVRAMVSRLGSKRGWNGHSVPTLLVVDGSNAATGAKLFGHLWMTTGKWARSICPGDVIEFDARASAYHRGYRGHREEISWERPVEQDWKLTRPTRVTVVNRHEQPR